MAIGDPGCPNQPGYNTPTEDAATLGRPSQTEETKPLAEWMDDEIEAAILTIGGLFAKKLALDIAKMTEPDLQAHERQLNYLFDIHEMFQIERIRRDAERLKQAALAECLVIFSMNISGKGGQPRTPALARALKDAEKAGQPRMAGVVKVKKNERA